MKRCGDYVPVEAYGSVPRTDEAVQLVFNNLGVGVDPEVLGDVLAITGSKRLELRNDSLGPQRIVSTSFRDRQSKKNETTVFLPGQPERVALVRDTWDRHLPRLRMSYNFPLIELDAGAETEEIWDIRCHAATARAVLVCKFREHIVSSSNILLVKACADAIAERHKHVLCQRRFDTAVGSLVAAADLIAITPHETITQVLSGTIAASALVGAGIFGCAALSGVKPTAPEAVQLFGKVSSL